MKFVAQYEAAKDWGSIVACINAALILQIIVGIVGSAALILFADPILLLLKVNDELFAAARTSLYIASGVFLVSLLAATLNSVLAGLQRYRVVSALGNGSIIGTMILSVIALMAGGGLVVCVAISGVASVALFLLAAWQVHKSIREWRFSFRVDWSAMKSLFSFSGYVFVTKISDTINNYIGRFLVAAFLGPAAVTYYMVPSKLVNGVWGVLVSGVGVIVPFASKVQASADRAYAQRLCEKSSTIFAAIALPLFCSIVLFSPWLLKLWMGEEFAQHSQGVLSLLGISGIAAAVTSVPIQLAFGFGKSKTIAVFGLVALAAYVSALGILVPSYGVNGAALALSVAALPGFALVATIVHRIFSISPVRYAWSVYKWHLPGVAATLGVWGLRTYLVGVPPLVNLFLSVLVIVAYGAIVLFKRLLPFDILKSLIFQRAQTGGHQEVA